MVDDKVKKAAIKEGKHAFAIIVALGRGITGCNAVRCLVDNDWQPT
jgi:hypothetical protein